MEQICRSLGILLNTQLARECPAQDRLAQALGALEVGIDLGFGLADQGEVAVYLGDDAVSLPVWRKWNANGSNSFLSDVPH